MSGFYVRSRGRVDGPYSLKKIQSLLQRRRIGRHCHISIDRKQWEPAGDFFKHRQRPRHGDFDDSAETFDDEASSSTSLRSRRHDRHFPADESDEYDSPDQDAVEIDDRDRDEDFLDDDRCDGKSSPGILTPPGRWLRANAGHLLLLTVVVSLTVAALFPFRETWGQDSDDLAELRRTVDQIARQHSVGANQQTWLELEEEVHETTAPMVARLSVKASAQDHVKQELLFVARDDIPLMLTQLPHDNHKAGRRVLQRFERVEEMIGAKQRQHLATILSVIPEIPALSQLNGGPSNSGQSTNEDSAPQTEEKPGAIKQLRSQLEAQREQMHDLFHAETQTSGAAPVIPGRPPRARPMTAP